MAYNYIQTFFLDANAVNGSSRVLLSSIDLFVKKKPNRNTNRSGFRNPTISVQICKATRSEPILENLDLAQRSTKSWDNITVSSNSKTATTFTFDPPVPILTNEYYGILINVSDNDFLFWDVVQGHRLVGTNKATSGPHGKYDGYLFEGTSDKSFRAIRNKDLKFNVKLAKFTANTSVTANLVPENYEFLSVDSITNRFMINEKVFQDISNPGLPVPVLADLPGNLSINALSNRIDGQGTNFLSSVSNGSIIVLSTSNSTFAVATVDKVTNSTSMTIVNNVALNTVGFDGKYRVSPTATMNDPAPYFGRTNELVLFRSTANSAQRFIGRGLRGVTVSNTGAGYSNTNVVRIQNPSGTDAVFTINTNNSGSISSLTVLNPGSGFIAPVANGRIEVSSSDTTLKAGNPGANAVVTVANNQIGLMLRGVTSGATANIISIDNKQISEIWPTLQEVNTPNGNVAVKHAFSNTTLGVSNALFRDSNLGILNTLKDYPATLASKSNEIAANSGPSSKLSVTLGVNQSNTFLFEAPMLDVDRSTLQTYENDINNDASNEHTNSGNAVNKYISKRISFNRETASEDLIVYLSANRPVGTSIKVYAKFHNNNDSEAFDDKLWTELDQVTANVFAPVNDQFTTTKIEYSIPQYPTVSAELPGVIATSNNSTTISGTGTSFANTLIGRLIRIYSPLQPTNHQIVSVSAVTNATSLTVGSPIVNNSVQESVVGTGLKAQLLKYSGTAFNNILNDNVARYHTMSNQAEMDGFDTFAIKVILLSDNKYIVPSVDDIQMIGTSA